MTNRLSEALLEVRAAAAHAQHCLEEVQAKGSDATRVAFTEAVALEVVAAGRYLAELRRFIEGAGLRGL